MVASNPFSKFTAAAPTGAAFPITPMPTAPIAKPARDMRPYRYAIRSIESAGSGDYRAIGPVTDKGARAIGAYQIMDYNVGPWTKKWLGFEMTPEQFLNSETAQDLVFDREFGSYLDKFGEPAAAAQAWFGGEGSVGKTDRSDGYITVGQYGQKFLAALEGGKASGYAMTGSPGGATQRSGLTPETEATARDYASQIKGIQPPQLQQEPQRSARGVSMSMGGGADATHAGPAEDHYDPTEAYELIERSKQRNAARRQNRRPLPQIERRSTPRNGETRNG